MEFERRDVWVGAVLMGALAAFAAVLLVVNRERLSSETYRVEIQLPNIAGLDKGTEVIHKGYKVGAVERVSVAYEPDFTFHLLLAIKREIRLRKGTQAIVKSKGLGGSAYLVLESPADGSPEGLVKDGDTLPAMMDTDLLARANDVMNDVQRFVKDLDKGGAKDDIQQTLRQAKAAMVHLDMTLVQMNALLAEDRKALKSTLEQAQGATTQINELLRVQNKAIQGSLENVHEATRHLPAILANVEEFTADVKRRPWRLLRIGKEEKEPDKKKK
ncbi:MAG: MlaD family protein [Elusimicrobiota bacterium]